MESSNTSDNSSKKDFNSQNERFDENISQNNWCSEERLIKALRKGEENAYRFLYKTYASKIGALAKSFMGSDDVDDVIQEVFLKIYKNIKKFRGESRLSTWIYKIAINVCRDHYKKYKGRDVLIDLSETNDSDEYQTQYSTDEDIQENVANEFSYEKLRKAIERLSPTDRMILYMKEVDGLTYSEIGKIIDKPEGTVKSRLHYIKKELRTALKEESSDEYDE
ncbi:MAG: RNA polymerase sigma factor [Fervidobacterium sp.]|uniref:RNA polymerase sigma factor n=1 Tax=Fervidobacterium sp. TaxID=1871331 RepID=UPI00404B2C8E